jgi:hypothetical protein
MTGPAEVMPAPARLPGRLAFAPDGALLAAGATVIDVRSGQVLRVLRGQLTPVAGAATCHQFPLPGDDSLSVSASRGRLSISFCFSYRDITGAGMTEIDRRLKN